MTGEDVAWTFIREAYKSVARTAVVTLQASGGAAGWGAGAAGKGHS